MPLPEPIAPQTLQGLKSNAQLYETMSSQIAAHNQLLQALSPGNPVTAANFAGSQGVSISGVTGTFKRGSFVASIGTNPTPNPIIKLAFPASLFASQPYFTVLTNGGTGSLPFTWSDTVGGLTISLNGTPQPNTNYNFRYTVTE